MVCTSRRQPKTEQHAQVRIVTLPDNRTRIEPLACEFASISSNAGRHLLLDFTNVEFITGEDLAAILSLRKRVVADGGNLTLFNLRAEIYEVFTVTRLHTILEICRP